MLECRSYHLCLLLFAAYIAGCASSTPSPDHHHDHHHHHDKQQTAHTDDNIEYERAYQERKYSPSPVNKRSASVVDNMIICGGKRVRLAQPVQQVTAYLESKSIKFNSTQLSDCSGIFHRVLNLFSGVCPEYDRPPVKQYRTTRDIARWYHEQGELTLVKGALENMDLIKPGAVMFYGQHNRRYKRFSYNDLFNPSTGIHHMGVVVSVERDKNGRVESYRLFHGRRPGTVAKTTTHRSSTSRTSYPALGNGSQQWVALALLVDPAN